MNKWNLIKLTVASVMMDEKPLHFPWAIWQNTSKVLEIAICSDSKTFLLGIHPKKITWDKCKDFTAKVSTAVLFFVCLLFLKIYLFIQRERERGAQAEGEAGSMQEAWLGTWSWVSRITPQAAGSAKPLCHQGCPTAVLLMYIYCNNICHHG